MNDNKNTYFYIAANLAFLLPVPGRFAYAVIMLILFNIQMATITLFFHAIHKMQLSSLRNSLLTLAIIVFSIFYKLLLTFVCPVAALTLGYCVFLPSLASVIVNFFFLDYERGVKTHLKKNMKKSLFMTFFTLVFFLIRDLFGYGTFTLPGWKKILVFHLYYNPESTAASSFLATIPGSLTLVSLLLALYIFLDKKITIISNFPAINSEDDLK